MLNPAQFQVLSVDKDIDDLVGQTYNGELTHLCKKL